MEEAHVTTLPRSTITACISQLPVLQSLTITILHFGFESDIGSFVYAICGLANSLRNLEISVLTGLLKNNGSVWEAALPRMLSACVSLISLKVRGAICSASVIHSIQSQAMRSLELMPEDGEDIRWDQLKDPQYNDFCSAVLQLSVLPLRKVVIYHCLSGVTDRDKEVQKQLRAALGIDDAVFRNIAPEDDSDEEENSNSVRWDEEAFEDDDSDDNYE